ncbi:MAG: hypothetical protein JJU00_01000 [Opitutales bacterium]|nr:hypothetical protein [Opitutales bacterium]
MKTVEDSLIKADSVIAEVRRAKTALAQKYDFDVLAMVRSLRERDERDAASKAADSITARRDVTPRSDKEPHDGQP